MDYNRDTHRCTGKTEERHPRLECEKAQGRLAREMLSRTEVSKGERVGRVR